MKKFRVEYIFNHPRYGFVNSVTVFANDAIEAIVKAKDAVYDTYASKFNRFTYKEPIQL